MLYNGKPIDTDPQIPLTHQTIRTWRDGSFKYRAKLAASCCYMIFNGLCIKNPRLANTAFECAQTFAALAVIPDYLGGEDEWNGTINKVIESIEKAVNS